MEHEADESVRASHRKFPVQQPDAVLERTAHWKYEAFALGNTVSPGSGRPVNLSFVALQLAFAYLTRSWLNIQHKAIHDRELYMQAVG